MCRSEGIHGLYNDATIPLTSTDQGSIEILGFQTNINYTGEKIFLSKSGL